MQQVTIEHKRIVHIISLWLCFLFLGMMLFHCFRRDFYPIIYQDSFPSISFLSLVLSSVVPVALVVLFLHFSCFFPCYVIVSLKAFFYGFSLSVYGGAQAGFLLFSQSVSSILLLLLIFIWLYKPVHSVKNLLYIFLFVDLLFILLDFFLICPLYS